MQAMVLDRIVDLSEEQSPLMLGEIPVPQPGDHEVLIRVCVCAVCHTELDQIEGRIVPPRLPIVLGHQVIGTVAERGAMVDEPSVGERIGVGWIHSACGECTFCHAGNENLCPEFNATGRDCNGGYAEYMTIPARFASPVPSALSDLEAAPLLCAGAIGYRSLRLTGLTNGQSLGLTGFGASAHLVLKMARHQYPDSPVCVFARSKTEQAFALELGAAWAGDIQDQPPELLHAIIDTTPVWRPVVAALKRLAPGGRLVINAIRKESVDQDVLARLDYPSHLWMEKEIKTVANVTRRDIREFLQLAAEINIVPEFQTFALEDANHALLELKRGDIRGAKVLQIS